MTRFSTRMLLLALTLPAHALTVRGYDAADHDRFTGFPEAPVTNPDFIHDASKFTGVGWWIYTSVRYGTIYSPIAAVSPRHLLCATHASPAPGTTVRFVDSAGNLVPRTVASSVAVARDPEEPGDPVVNSDLCVVTLTAPLPATVAHYPWLNLEGGNPSYVGKNLVVLGQEPDGTPRGGKATLEGFDGEDGVIGNTFHLQWAYQSAGGLADDAALAPGDSGGPSFSLVAGQPAIVGVHSAIYTAGMTLYSLDSFLPHYVEKVNAILEPAGHRLRPAHFDPATLSIPAGAVDPASPRRLNPGSIEISVANLGDEVTGNLAITLVFPAGHEPDSITAPEAVAEAAGGGVWHVRKATLAAGSQLTVTADWAALPDLAAIHASVTADSDTASTVVAAPAYSLAPSYAGWAQGLAMPGQGDDPDGDSLENLLEYALGGDPENGAMVLPGGRPLRLEMTESAGIVSLSFPVRDDAELRGLSYFIETADHPAGLAGATTLPPGASLSTGPFVPDVPGFLKRTVTWPSDGPRRFARIRVELEE